MCDLGADDDDFPFLSFFSLKSEGLPQNLQMEEILGERGQIPSRPWLNLDRNSWIKNAQHDNKRHHKHLCSCFPSVPLKLIDRERESTWSVCSFLNRSAFYFVFLISQRHWSKGFPKLSHKSSWSFQAISAKMFKACQSTSMDHFSQMNVCAVACSYDSWAVLSHWNHHNLVLAI
jgi:hypothetical protein